MYRVGSRGWRIAQATSGGNMTPQQAIIFTLCFFCAILLLILILRFISRKW